MHGMTMIFLFVTPVLVGFGNYLVPLMIGARDMAFPRLNAFSYWVFLVAGLLHVLEPRCSATAPDDGWFTYAPLSIRPYSPGPNIDFYALGLIFLGISTTAGAINFIVTIFKLRAPGMSLNRMPLFCWAILATSFTIVFAVPVADRRDCLLLELDRKFGFHFFEPPRRRPAALAAPVLDLRPPRRLHHLPAGGRDRLDDHARLLAPADGRLHAGGARDDGDRRSSASACGCTTCSPPGCRWSR